MKLSLKSFTEFALGATDGEIGKIKEIYFDDRDWTARYLIVETDSWLFGRKVLISPQALRSVDWDDEIFRTNLTLKQIKDSPDIDSDMPVYRQEERRLADHYSWQTYWSSEIAGPGLVTPWIVPMNTDKPASDKQEETHDSHLRSSKKVTGYGIHATDGEIGHIEDFVVNINNWKIEFLIIETGSWLSSRQLILAPDRIKSISYPTSRIIVDVSVEEVKNSPEFDQTSPINEVYEKNLRDYYGQLIR